MLVQEIADLRRNVERLRDQLFALVKAKQPTSRRPRRGILALSIGAAERRRKWLKRAAGQ